MKTFDPQCEDKKKLIAFFKENNASEKLKQRYFNEWIACDPNDREKLASIHAKVRCVDDFASDFYAAIGDSKRV